MLISGDSVGAGNVKITSINHFSVKLSGEYNSLVMIYKDRLGVLSKVSGIIQNEGINIAALNCERSAKGEDASICMSLDAALNYSIIEKIKKIDDVYLVRHVAKLEN